MEQVLVSLLVYVITWALCLWKPNAARIFLGIFFLVMAIFTDIVGAAPLLFGLIAVAYETTTGLLILSSGRRAQAGLIMGIIFLVGITPLSLATQANPVLALALQYLLFQPHTHSLPQQLRLRFARG